MGYYKGKGVTTGGGSTVTVFENFLWNGVHNVYQRHTSTTTRKAGVSLETAKAAEGTCALSAHRFTWTANGATSWHWSFNCKGTTVTARYAQINGSNLYELQVETDTVQAKLDDGGWVS